MKKLIPILLSVFIAFSYGAKKEIEKYPNGNKKSQVKLNKEGQKHGEYKAYYENKEIQITGKYENGMMMGTWTYYYDNKNIKGIFNFLNGDGSDVSEVSGVPENGRHGQYTYYYENQQKRSEGNYKDGNLDGEYTSYYENGQLKKETNWKDGNLDGLKISYHENGQIEQEGNYKDDKRVGKWTDYFENGNPKGKWYLNNDGTRDSTKLTSRWYETGSKKVEGYVKTINDSTRGWHGKLTIYHENGQIEQEGNYKNGEREDGKWINYYENGQIKSEANYKNGKKEDGKRIYFQYNENGQKTHEVNYKNDKLHGKYTTYNEDGQKEEVNYKDNKKDGKWTAYNENGQIEQEGNYKDGKHHGKRTNYYENGQKEEEVNYKDDKKDGKWTAYNENGQIEQEGNYKDDKHHGKRTNYYENGTIWSEENINYDCEYSSIYYSENGKVILEVPAKYVHSFDYWGETKELPITLKYDDNYCNKYFITDTPIGDVGIRTGKWTVNSSTLELKFDWESMDMMRRKFPGNDETDRLIFSLTEDGILHSNGKQLYIKQ